MARKNPSVLEALLGEKTTFSELSTEHKKALLKANPPLHFLSHLFNIINSNSIPLPEPEKFRFIIQTAKKFSSGISDHDRLRFYELACSTDTRLENFKRLNSFFEYYTYKKPLSFAFFHYFKGKHERNPQEGLDALEAIQIGIRHIKKDYITMGRYVSFMHAYDLPNKFMDEDLAHLKRLKKSVYKALLDYEMQLTGVEKHECVVYTKLWNTSELSKGNKIINPLF